MLTRRSLLGWFAAVPLLLSQEAEATGSDWVLIRQRGYLRAAADPLVGAPYFFRRAGQYTGFEWEILSALCARLEVRLEVSEISWPEQLGALLDQKVDLVLNGHEVPAVPAVGRLPYEATRPYYVSSQRLLLAAEAPPVRTLAELARSRVGVIIDSGGWALVNAFNTRYRNSIRIAGFRSPTALVDALVAGQLDAVLLDAPVAAWQSFLQRNIRLADFSGLPTPLVGLVRAQDQSTRAQLDLALAQMAAAGQLRGILRRWNLWDRAQLSG